MRKLKKFSNFSPIVGLLTVLALVAGCTQLNPTEEQTFRAAQAVEAAEFQHVPEPALIHVGLTRESDATRTNQRILEINDVLRSRSAMFDAIDALSSRDYSSAKETGTLGDLIEQVRAEFKSAKSGDGEEQNESFMGVGGAFTDIFLEAAEQTLGETTNDFDDGTVVTVSVKGLLTDYKLFSDRSGHLENETQFVIRVNGIARPVIRFYWIIDVLPGVFEFHTHSMDEDDPFPGTLVFSEEMLERIKMKNFNRKLWAEGDRIKIRKLLIDFGDGQGYLPVPEGSSLLETHADSCIDMMFEVKQGGNIPRTYSELLTHSYCLGRCRSPAMVNSK